MHLHTRPTPLMGGVAVYLAFALVTITALPLTPPVVGLLLGGLAAIAVGLADEFLNLSPPVHLAGQVGAALVAVIGGVGLIHSVSDPFSSLAAPATRLPLVLAVVVTIFWLVAMMNTVNFLDGLDGLAAGVVALSALLLAIWALHPERFLITPTPNHEDLVMPLALVGALVGFLRYNWRPAKIFLGDTGALFLGLTIAGLAIIGPAKLATALLVLIIPVLDVAWAILRRSLHGRSFLTGDKQHVYHRMMEIPIGKAGSARRLSATQTVLLLYLLCIVLGGLDLFLVRFAKFIAILLLAVAAAAMFVILELRASGMKGESPEVHAARLRSLQDRGDSRHVLGLESEPRAGHETSVDGDALTGNVAGIPANEEDN